MMRRALAGVVVAGALAACGGGETAVAPPATPAAPAREARIPRAPGADAPSLVTIAHRPAAGAGAQLADVDTCASCHPDVAAQWSASAHSFASFGNPIYRYDVEQVRADLGKPASRHCAGCHDLPLLVDGLMAAETPIAADDLRAHSGVTCRLCHNVTQTSLDGNASYTWDATPLEAPVLGDAPSIARHRRAVTTKLDTQLCVGCHRGFLSPDMGLPVHLSGIDDTGAWQSSPYTGSGMARLDRVETRTCIDCHMERVPASVDELGAKRDDHADRTVASHRFVGGHTWMASMRGDDDQLRETRAKLEGAATIDIAGARVIDRGVASAWHVPADRAAVRAGTRLELDVVVRNLLVGHRFPGGLLDVQDTWIELELADARGRRLASSGLDHEADPTDDATHVLHTIVVDERGEPLAEHELAKFRAQIVTQTLAPREAQAVRYAFTVPANVALPVIATARLRHRSRNLRVQAAACRASQSKAGEAFLAGARATRDANLDPCKPQPITLVAETRVELGGGARASTARPAWQRAYELGMALASTIVTRLDEARAVLAIARTAAPDDRARAMVEVQLGWVAARQNRVDEALGHVRAARELLGNPSPEPAVLAAIVADAYARADRWAEAVAPARSCTERAPQNVAAWGLYARVLVAVGDHAEALAAAVKGLELAPRDPDLLRSQATALAALGDPRAAEAQAAYTKFRSPDEAAGLRIRCAARSAGCARDRNPVNTIELR